MVDGFEMDYVIMLVNDSMKLILSANAVQMYVCFRMFFQVVCVSDLIAYLCYQGT